MVLWMSKALIRSCRVCLLPIEHVPGPQTAHSGRKERRPTGKSPPELFLDSHIFWALAPFHWKRQEHMKMAVRLSLFVFPTRIQKPPSQSLQSHSDFSTTAATEEKTMLQAGTFIRGQFETSRMLSTAFCTSNRVSVATRFVCPCNTYLRCSGILTIRSPRE